MGKNLLQFDNLRQYSTLKHFSTTISGGVSKGNYSTFNLGGYSGDDSDNINENRRRLTNVLGISQDDLFLPYQTHGDTIQVIDQAFMSLSKEEKKERLTGVDALITNLKNIGIGVTTADCVPVLIYDPENHALGVAHAGWRGTVSCISAKTVQAMMRHFNSNPEKLCVAIAPSICSECFEVGDDVVDAFVNTGFEMDSIAFRNSNTGKIHIDLRVANELVLNRVGVLSSNIEVSDMCTFMQSDKFFSARRQTIHSGRMATGGVLM